MMMTIDNQYTAAALYNGGWRSDDREDLMEEYGINDAEADELCKELRKMEDLA